MPRSGGSRKRGRGGGGGRAGGAGKRQNKSNFQQPAIRRSSAAPGGRLSFGNGVAGPRNRSAAAASTPPAPSDATEDTFSLVSGDRFHFATIIRLTPDLVEEIKRAEAHGATTQIKFGSNASDSAWNVINVGGKDFRFTWSRDTGDLCDIYEERQSDEDGNGLLVESGSAWRKVNVQRVLDESTKNHVKMLSEEAERKSKSRKTIVLDSRNPSTNSQVKAMDAVEGNPCKRAFKQPPQRKRKFEPPPARSTPKASQKSGLSTITSFGCKKSTSSNLCDLQSTLTTVLMDNRSHGMTIKALEKAVREAFPNSGRQFETMLKKVAIFRAPGRYFLKPGVEMETLKKSTINNGSSPEENNSHKPPSHNKHEDTAPKSSLPLRADTEALEGPLQLNYNLEDALTSLEKVDIIQTSPDYFGEKNAPDHSKGPAGISSDSESNNSDSVGKSGSRSLGGTSESDASSNNESSNDAVGILGSDDDRGAKYEQKLSKNRLSKFPIQSTYQDSEPTQIRIGENKCTRVADILEIEKDLPDVEITNVNFGSVLIEENRIQTRKLVIESDLEEKQDDKPGATKRQKTEKMHQQQNSVSMKPLFAKGAVQDKHQTHVDSQPISQQHCSAVVQSVVKCHKHHKPSEVNSEKQHNITEGCVEFIYGDNHRMVSTGAAQYDISNDACKGKRTSSADEISPYFMYEKKEPELRLPIKGFGQYKEYVEEYHEKYEKYCLLNKNLESYRSEFHDIGKDLHVYKGKDMERFYETLERLKDSYYQHGHRHKRLKKIFIVLHEELKHLKQMINDFVASNGTRTITSFDP
ncbi:hypothetical protein DM860_014394 [Cuscuta australis]|uniref:OCEL domain-containing protein n=1 Tax=Cuscuta australis TaxID=267555 RepID=A0A328DIN8_9ASTE|nr:hypothetical protein DM860_014394 [Cuscuta australis]